MSGVLQVLPPRRLPHECTARDAAGCALCRQVLCILRKDTDVWALPGGMVRGGESVSDAVRKSIQACGDFKDGLLTSSAEVQKKKRQFDMLVEKLFSGGVPVFMVRRPTLLSLLASCSLTTLAIAPRATPTTPATRTTRGWKARPCTSTALRSWAHCFHSRLRAPRRGRSSGWTPTLPSSHGMPSSTAVRRWGSNPESQSSA